MAQSSAGFQKFLENMCSSCSNLWVFSSTRNFFFHNLINSKFSSGQKMSNWKIILINFVLNMSSIALNMWSLQPKYLPAVLWKVSLTNEGKDTHRKYRNSIRKYSVFSIGTNFYGIPLKSNSKAPHEWYLNGELCMWSIFWYIWGFDFQNFFSCNIYRTIFAEGFSFRKFDSEVNFNLLVGAGHGSSFDFRWFLLIPLIFEFFFDTLMFLKFAGSKGIPCPGLERVGLCIDWPPQCGLISQQEQHRINFIFSISNQINIWSAQ